MQFIMNFDQGEAPIDAESKYDAALLKFSKQKWLLNLEGPDGQAPCKREFANGSFKKCTRALAV